MTKIQNKEVFAYIIKQPMLRYTLLISIATAIFFPIYSFYFIFPQFNSQLKNYTQDAAIRVATHLKETLYTHGLSLTKESFSNNVIKDIVKLKQDLRIEKIKIFSHSGVVLYSSNPEDIGKKNTHDYFYEKIVLGEIYSKIVRKNTKTLEGRVVNFEVVESYVPLMQEGVFKGAFEIYYDITSNYKALTRSLNKLKITISAFSITFLIVILAILFKAGRNRINRENAEVLLFRAHSQLEHIVEERTKDLKNINRSLKHEIKERNATKISLQHSHDTQTIVNLLLRESLGNASLMNVINKCLDLVLSLSWLSFDAMGCIYLVENESNVLVLKAHRGFSKDLQKKCSKIAFGKCLCGLAASTQKTIFSKTIDERHEILLPGTPDHGHYCIPVIAKSVTLGVINIYLKPGHKRTEPEENFLKILANYTKKLFNFSLI
ncbi:MAG: GAF domain-containing protein [Desulfobacula sp.]|nr:GAF domain-containing protein [Desulfobacula sp.]